MPKLPTQSYSGGEAPAFGGRRASAEDFAGSAAGMVQAGRVVQHAATELMTEFEQQEKRRALVETTRIHAETAKELDDAVAGDGDVDKVKEKMLARLAAVGADFQTRAGADTLTVETSQAEYAFDRKAQQVAAARAWAEAQRDGQSILNNIGAQLQTDPNYLKTGEGIIEQYVNTFPKLSAPQRIELSDSLKKSANMSAVMAAARLNPEKTKADLEAGKYFLTPEQRETGIAKADQFANAKKEVEEHEKARQRKERADREEAAKLNLTRRIFSGEVGPKIYQEIVTNPDLDTNGTTQMMSLLKQHRKDLQGGEGTAKTTPSIFNDLRERISLPDGDPRKISNVEEVWKAYGKGLSKTDAEDLEKRVLARRTDDGRKWDDAEKEVIRNLRPQLDRSTMVNLDVEGGARVQKFTQFVRDKANQYRAMKPPKDPSSLLNPNSPDYVGNEISRFQSGSQRRAAGIAASVNEALDPKKARKPGETPAEYLKRMGK